VSGIFDVAPSSQEGIRKQAASRLLCAVLRPPDRSSIMRLFPLPSVSPRRTAAQGLRASPTQHLPGVPLPGIQITQSARFAGGGSGEQRRRDPPCPSGRVMHSMVITSDTLKRHKAPANGGKVDMAGRLASRHPHAGRCPVSAGASDDHTPPLAGPITRAGHVAANGSRSNNSPKGKSLYPGPLLVIIGSVPSSPAPQEKTDGQAAGLKGQLLL
jgi:hypothetical protein